MKKTLLSLLMGFTAILGDLGMAQAFDAGVEDSVVICSSQDNRRIITLNYETGGLYLPCQVIYEKPTEEPDYQEELWNAKYEVGYCETKMDGLIQKLEEGGWECSKRGQNMMWGIPERPQEWYVILGRFSPTPGGLEEARALRNKFSAEDDFIVGHSDFYADLTEEGAHVMMKGPFPNQLAAQDWAYTDAVQEIVPDASIQKATFGPPKKPAAKDD